MRIIKRICVFTFILMLILGLTGSLLVHFYQDEIKAKAIEAVDRNIDTRIDVQSVDFTIFQSFPKAGLLFKKVKIYDVLDTSRVMLSAEELSLQFGLLDLINGSYTINRAAIDEGELQMYLDNKGRENYIFWKETEDEGEMEFAIEELKLTDIQYRFEDHRSGLLFNYFLTKGNMELQMEAEGTALDSELQGNYAYLRIDDDIYIDSISLAQKGKTWISTDGNSLELRAYKLESGGIEIPLKASFDLGEKRRVDLKAELESDLKSLFKILPDWMYGGIAEVNVQAEFNSDIHVLGEFGGKTNPEIIVDYALRRGELRWSEKTAAIQSIQSKGRFRQSIWGTRSMKFEELKAQLDQGSVNYVGEIKNMRNWDLHGKFQAEASIQDILALVPIEEIESAHGELSVELNLAGPLPIDKLDEKTLKALNMDGLVNGQGLSLQWAGENSVQAEEIEWVVRKDLFLMDETAMTLNGDSLYLSTRLKGLWAYLFNEQGRLQLESELRSPALALNSSVQSNESKSPLKINLPERIDWRAAVDIESFAYQEFRASEIMGIARGNDKELALESASMKTCQGKVAISGMLRSTWGGNWALSSNGHIDRVDFRNLFQQLDNLGQDFVRAEHIKGRGDMTWDMKASLDSLWQLDTQSLESTARINIEDGELIEHPSMVDIISQLKERRLLKPFVRVDELEQEMHHLRFAQLENTIRISEGKIEIPRMLIANNAMDIGIEGRHGFDQTMDYRLDFTLRDILVNKRNPEFLIQDDGLGHRIRLSISGDSEDFLVEMDRDAVKQNRKEAITEAKEDVKEFFKNPFKKKEDDEKKDDRSAVKVEIESEEKEIEKKPKKKTWLSGNWNLNSEEEAPSDDGDDF